MKDYALELALSQTGANAKLNIMREYLQAYILRIMHDLGIFHSCAFLGGTALRFLYNLPRFSEDIDFSLIRKMEQSFIDLIAQIKKELKLAGYSISISYKDQKTVQFALIKFEDLMYETKISPLRKQKLSIKIEIDTNPPLGAGLITKIVNKHFPISFLSYDIPSLFAGKFHALLTRKYIKGRDYFDISWYLSRFKQISPNITFLHNALKQTGWDKEMPLENNWRDYLYRVVEETEWKVVNQDVKNFLERAADMNIFTKENVLGLIKEL
ncbi:MAG: nucleotidyl transferase AbiEii/AbiGii toxin family protein [Spirochaetes bacterium]|nr:nucleotidyl transferase AbiEii/AbiGii toxin family protein [Spirochaetota bacterium]